MDYDKLKNSVNEISSLACLLYEASDHSEETVKVLAEVIQDKITNLKDELIQ